MPPAPRVNSSQLRISPSACRNASSSRDVKPEPRVKQEDIGEVDVLCIAPPADAQQPESNENQSLQQVIAQNTSEVDPVVGCSRAQAPGEEVLNTQTNTQPEEIDTNVNCVHEALAPNTVLAAVATEQAQVRPTAEPGTMHTIQAALDGTLETGQIPDSVDGRESGEETSDHDIPLA